MYPKLDRRAPVGGFIQGDSKEVRLYFVWSKAFSFRAIASLRFGFVYLSGNLLQEKRP